MNPLVRDFKRHYHKTKEVYSALAQSGNFGFQAKSDGMSITASCKTPDPVGTVRFAVLMRRFLMPEDGLHYKKVWAGLQEDNQHNLPAEMVEGINSLIRKVEAGYGKITINSEEFSPRKIYETVSDGGYFSDDERAAEFLRNISRVPMVGPLLLHQFYEYMLGCFSIASALFDAILISEQQAEPTEVPIKNLCIYCLKSDGSFSSEEHIVAESLGNYDTVLPKGYVCDECNNGVLSLLDEALIKFEPIAWLRVYFVPYTKAGKLPEANFHNFSIAKTGPRQITIKPKDKTGHIKTVEQLGDDLYRYNMSFKGKKLNWALIGRTLFKIGLGMVAMKQGREYACSTRFDAARDFIRGKTNIRNKMLVRTKSQPHPSVQVVYLDQPEGTPFFIDFFGLAFMFNLEMTPEVVLQEDLVNLNFKLVSLERPEASRTRASST